jgi:hypothetical protein
MTPQDIHKLQGYLRTVLDARHLAIKAHPKKKTTADVLVGDKPVGRIEVDDEDDELTYQVEINVPIKPVAFAATEIARAQAELNKVLGSAALSLKARLSPKTMKPMLDSCEVFAAKESLGTLTAERDKYVFQFPVFDMDIEAFDAE